MPNRCVAYGCKTESKDGKAVFLFPSEESLKKMGLLCKGKEG